MAITSAPSDYAGLFHALRATGTARPVPRGLPPLFAPPGTAPNPWLFWCLGGGLLGVLLSLREPWIERLGHALSLGMWGVVLGGAWRTLRWLLRRRSHAASCGGRGARVPVRLWPGPRRAALCPAERGAPAPAVLPLVARGRTRARGAGHAPGARPPRRAWRTAAPLARRARASRSPPRASSRPPGSSPSRLASGWGSPRGA